MSEDHRARAAAQMTASLEDICHEVVRLQEEILPHLADRPLDGRLATARALVTGIQHLVRGSPADLLLGALRDTTIERVRSGASPGELAVVPHCYAAAVRSVFVAELGAAEGLALFAPVESCMWVALRLVARQFDEVLVLRGAAR